jgi:hypothetical protein
MPFSPAITNPIDLLLQKRSKIVEILIKHNKHQDPAPGVSICVLRKLGYRYCVFNQSVNRIELAHGFYLYVIRSWEPWRIVCAKLGSVGGHTSLNRDEQGHLSSVHFAGELDFVHGKLQSWNNGSGHYLPNAALHSTNLLPHIALMLPTELFKPAIGGRILGYKDIDS